MAIYKLGEIAKVSDGYHGGFPDGGDIPFISAKDVTWNNLNMNTKMISKSDYNRAESRSKILKNTILFTNSGTLGNTHISSKTIKVGVQKSIALIDVFDKRIIPKYLAILINVKSYEQISAASGSAQKNILLKDLRNWKLKIPSKIIQQKIIDIIEPIEDSLFLISKIKNKIKKILIMKYKISNNERILLNDLIDVHNNKYDSQKKYIATNGVGEMMLNEEKIINVSLNNKPSRANLTPIDNSFIISKLIGENKVYYINKSKYVFSTGFLNIKTENEDHLLGFLLSIDFIAQKNKFSTGTTMAGITNKGLENITIKKCINKQGIYTKLYNYLLKLEIGISNNKKRMIKLLIK